MNDNDTRDGSQTEDHKPLGRGAQPGAERHHRPGVVGVAPGNRLCQPTAE